MTNLVKKTVSRIGLGGCQDLGPMSPVLTPLPLPPPPPNKAGLPVVIYSHELFRFIYSYTRN